MATEKRYRSAISGKLVTKEYAEANPSTTVSETIDIEPDDTQEIVTVDEVED